MLYDVGSNLNFVGKAWIWRRRRTAKVVTSLVWALDLVKEMG